MDNIYKQEQEIKYETYEFLMITYIETIHRLIDYAYKLNILPLKLIFGINYMKKYINENRFETLQNGINYLLRNKEVVLGFDIKNLDELDIDSDDNMSVKSCVNNLKKSTGTKYNFDTSLSNEFSNEFSNNIPSDTDQLLNLMIDIKNNAKKLPIQDIELVKKHFEIIIMVLEQIEKLFL